MSMDKRRIAAAIVKAAIALGLVASFILGLDLSPFSGALKYSLSVLLSAAGLAIGFLLHSLCHETGHAIGAKSRGAKLTFLSIGALDVDLTQKTPKLSFNFKSVYAGGTSFVCNSPIAAPKTLKSSLAGGFIGSLVCLAVCAVGLAFANYYLYYLLFFGSFSALYMLCVNFITADRTYDGAAIGNITEFSSRAALLYIESNLYLGISLSETDFCALNDLCPDRYDNYYDLLRALETGDVLAAKDIADKLISDPETADNEYIAALFEKFFIAAVQNDGDYIDQNFDEFSGYADDSLPYLRALAAYLARKGEYEWGAKVAASYLKTLDCEPVKGYKKTERNVWNLYLAAKDQD